MRTWPFYSPFLGLAVEAVWHDNSKCEIARSIAYADRRAGTDDRKHCAYCQMHNEPTLKKWVPAKNKLSSALESTS